MELGRKDLGRKFENEVCEIIDRDTGDIIAVVELSANGLFKLCHARNSKMSPVTALTNVKSISCGTSDLVI